MKQCLGGGLLSLSLSLSLVSQLFICNLFFQFFKSFCSSCHFEPLQKGEKSTKIKRKLAIFGYFATAQYDSKRVIASRFCENGVAIHKFRVIFAFWIATLALLARNDGQGKCTLLFHNDSGFCHFERSEKSKEFKIRFVYGYFANAQYDKFGLLSKNNGYFHSNFKTQIQIFYSKFKAFYKFNSFHKFISKFKPYTRLVHIFTPNFRSVFTDKFNTKGEAMAFTNEQQRYIELIALDKVFNSYANVA